MKNLEINQKRLARKKEILALNVITPNEFADSFFNQYLFECGVDAAILAIEAMNPSERMCVISGLRWIADEGFTYRPIFIGGPGFNAEELKRLRALLRELAVQVIAKYPQAE